MNPLFSPIEFNKVDFINIELYKSIKHLKYCNTIESNFIRVINYIIESIDDSVAKIYGKEDLPYKKVVKRIK